MTLAAALTPALAGRLAATSAFDAPIVLGFVEMTAVASVAALTLALAGRLAAPSAWAAPIVLASGEVTAMMASAEALALDFCRGIGSHLCLGCTHCAGLEGGVCIGFGSGISHWPWRADWQLPLP